MPSLRSVGLWFALGVGVSACGGSIVSANGEDGSITSSPEASTDGPDFRLDATTPLDGTTGVDGGSAPDVALSPSCPASPPQGGASCSPAGLQCEYGSSYDFECNVVATCDAQTGKWSVQTGNCSQPFDAGGCPDPSTTGLAGTSCATNGASCNLTTQHCDCQLGCGAAFLDGGRWVCDGPKAGCPEPRPRLGSACTAEGQQCDYTLCCAGGTMTCQGGLWQGHLMSGGCP